MNADKTDLKKKIRNCFAALSVFSFLIRVSPRISAARLLVVGVGIEPTFRAFQTRANPSQLSDQRMNWPQMNTDNTDKKLHPETIGSPPFYLCKSASICGSLTLAASVRDALCP